MSLFTQKEISKYSVTKAIAEMSNHHAPGFHAEGATGLEREIHDTLASRMKDAGHTPTGFLLPLAALKALNVTTATAGGFLVGEDLAQITPALRAKSVCVSLGAQVFENLRSDLALPLETATSQAQWLGEMETLTTADLTAYSKTKLTPRRCACMTTISRQLLSQDSLGIENFVRDSLMRTISQAIDKGALSGVGDKEPVGILNMDGTATSVTFGATTTRAKVVSFQDSLTASNVGNTPDASLGYVTSHTTASKWMQTQEVTGGDFFLWQGNQWSGTVAGLPARATANAGTGNQVICGDWSRVVVGFWNSEAIQILVDPYTKKDSALIDVYATAFADIGVANPLNFCVSTDSGAQ